MESTSFIFLQVAGMRYAWELKKPAGSRVHSVEIRAQDKFTQLDPDKFYSIVMRRFLFDGGGGLAWLKASARNVQLLSESLDESLVSQIKHRGELGYQNEGRIVRIEE